MSTVYLSRRRFLVGLAGGSWVAVLGHLGCSQRSGTVFDSDPTRLDLVDASRAVRTQVLSPVDLTRAGLDRPMAPTAFQNQSTEFLVPYVAAQREDQNEVRTGWVTIFGIYNPTGGNQKYRVRYFDDNSAGIPVAEFLSTNIPSKNNVFDTVETTTQPRAGPWVLHSGNDGDLKNRNFLGYATVEQEGNSADFFLSSWMARGGGFTVAPLKSFGFNRASWLVPCIPVSTFQNKRTTRLIFPGLTLHSKGTEDDCTKPETTGLPNGLDGAVSLVNMGDRSVKFRLAFVKDGTSMQIQGNQVVTLQAKHRLGIVLSNHFANDLGRGVLIANIQETDANKQPVLGLAAQSDARFQFLGFGITGQAEFVEGSGSPPSVITNKSNDFRLPYALRVGAAPPHDDAFDTEISIFNPGGSSLTAKFEFFSEDGDLQGLKGGGTSVSIAVASGGALCRRMNELGVPDGFVGSARITAGSKSFYCAARAVRGGFDNGLFGWQSYAFDIPAIPNSTITSVAGSVLTAVNETTALPDGPFCPPLPPAEDEDTDLHDNGFECGIRVVNVGSESVEFDLKFQKRFVNSTQPIEESSLGPYTLSQNQSRGFVLGAEFQNPGCSSPPCPTDRSDGMVIIRLKSGTTGKIIAFASESDKYFRWFGYSVTGQHVSSGQAP